MGKMSSEYYREYYKKNKERVCEIQRRYRKTEKCKKTRQKWNEKNREKLRESHKQSNRKLKEYIINLYSNGKNRCECCGESHIEFLTLDHIYGGGRLHRQQVGENIYIWLKRSNFPDREKYRVLCMNCNLSFGVYGYCPHKDVTKEMK